MTLPEWIRTIDIAIVCLALLALICIIGAIGAYRSHHTLDEFDQPWIEPRPYTPAPPSGYDTHKPTARRPALYDQDTAP